MPNSAAISKNNAFGAWRRILPAVISLGFFNLGLAAKMDAARVFRGAKGPSADERAKRVRSVYAAPDGTVWVVAQDYSEAIGKRDSLWYVRRLGSDGSCLSGDMLVFPPSDTMETPLYVTPVGATADGSLVVDIAEPGGRGERHLAKIGPSGATAVSGVLPPHNGLEPFVFMDRDGVAHLRMATTVLPNYMQVDLTKEEFPVLRTLDYAKPFDDHASAPQYLRWTGSFGTLPGQWLAFYSEERARLLVTCLSRADSFSSYPVYRIDTKTLGLLDSGRVNLARDAYRTWSGPTVRRTRIVPAGKSGYWLFHPTGDSPPAPTVVAYRLRPDLKVVRPAAVEADEARRFDAAPADAVVSIECPYQSPNYLPGGRVRFRLVLDFTAFGRDGRLYTQTFQDSVVSTWSK